MATKSAATKAHEATAKFYNELAAKTALERAQLERQEHRYQSSQDANRLYTFEVPVVQSTASDCMGFIGQWYREDSEQPIQIIFNSPGGAVFSGLALYDYIKQLRTLGATINTSCIGAAMSMAGILLQAGEERTMGANAHLLIHEFSDIGGDVPMKTSEQEDHARFLKKLQKRGVSILAERSTLSETQITRRWKRIDWWLDAEEALELGFCDRVE